MTISYSDAAADLTQAYKTLHNAWNDENDPAHAASLYALMRRVGDEIDEIARDGLSASNAAFVPLTADFRQGTADAKRFLDDIQSAKKWIGVATTVAGVLDKVVSYVT